MRIYDKSFWGALEERRATLDAVEENSGRVAKHYATWTTKGIGEIKVTECFRFKILFLEEPIFTSGMALADDADLVDGHYPRATVGVYEWERTAAGHYTGAYLFFVVDTLGPGQTAGQEPQYEIVHHLAWEGKAIKNVPAHLLDLT